MTKILAVPLAKTGPQRSVTPDEAAHEPPSEEGHACYDTGKGDREQFSIDLVIWTESAPREGCHDLASLPSGCVRHSAPAIHSRIDMYRVEVCHILEQRP